MPEPSATACAPVCKGKHSCGTAKKTDVVAIFVLSMQVAGSSYQVQCGCPAGYSYNRQTGCCQGVELYSEQINLLF